MGVTKKNYKSLKRFIPYVGWLFILTALGILLLTFGPLVIQELWYKYYRLQNVVVRQQIAPVDTTFGIVIPKLGANAKIIKNVDPYDSNIYQQALTKGVAHAKGSGLPGQSGNMFLFSHSSVDLGQAQRYNAIFYLLDKLEKEDTIDVYYYGHKYTYKVTEKKLVSAKSVEYLTSKTDKKRITLMTCWPAGTSLMRLIVIGEI